MNRSKQGQPGCCRKLFAATVFLCVCLNGFSQTTNSFFQFVQNQSQRHYTQVPHEVLAFYYGWYGQPPGRDPWHGFDTNKHEIFGAQRYPVKGPYSSHDTAIIDWQIDQAKASGVTGFIISWWGTGDWDSWHEQSLTLLLEHAEKKDFKISIYWERAPGEGNGQIALAVDELSHVLKKHGNSKAFLKVDGKPVIFAYSRVTLFQVPAISWPAIIEGVRARAGDFVLMADGHHNSFTCLFDGIHSYDLNGLPDDLQKNLEASKLDELRAWAANYYQKGVKIARERSRISCLMVMPGSDARKAYKWNTQMNRLDGQTYRTLWGEAIKANPDWVIITSWNEWPEGTEIEPSLELGDKYLQITAEYSKRFLGSARIDVPAPAPLPRFAPGTTQELDKLLVNRKIAVLVQNQVNDAEFWPAYCGAILQRVTWKELVDPNFFNASNFPVFVHVAAENYTSSIKVTDDVTRSLARYLHEGGFLVSLPSRAPWPLHYDDSRKGIPFAITDKLALGVDNGFERPPPGVEFTFHAKTNVLFGLSATASFPKTGDLRWRPASRTRVPANDVYVPLIQLKDSTGKFQGDAVAYVEHRVLPLSPGKSIYVWMRTAEAFEPEVFLPSLYQFISTRLKPLPLENP